MIVILRDKITDVEEYVVDAACVVIDQYDPRICWDGGREDRSVDLSEFDLAVVPSVVPS